MDSRPFGPSRDLYNSTLVYAAPSSQDRIPLLPSPAISTTNTYSFSSIWFVGNFFQRSTCNRCFNLGQMGGPRRAFALRSRRRSRSLLAPLKEELRFAGGALSLCILSFRFQEPFPHGVSTFPRGVPPVLLSTPKRAWCGLWCPAPDFSPWIPKKCPYSREQPCPSPKAQRTA